MTHDKYDGLEPVRRSADNLEDVEIDAPAPHFEPRSKNVTPPLAAEKHFSPRAQALFEATIFAGHIAANLDNQYLIKGWLYRTTISMIYGPSNVGKSFLAVDIAHHVAKGMGWGNQRVKRGRVLCVAAEGGSTFTNRIAALDKPELWILRAPMTLTGDGSDANPVIAVLEAISKTGGAPFDLIIVDTMSRVMGSKDENHPLTLRICLEIWI